MEGKTTTSLMKLKFIYLLQLYWIQPIFPHMGRYTVQKYRPEVLKLWK